MEENKSSLKSHEVTGTGRILTIEFGGAKMFMDYDAWVFQKSWYDMQDWIWGQCAFFGYDPKDVNLQKAAHKKFGIEYKEPEPSRLGYFIITDRGTMWKEGDKVFDFKKDSMYELEEEPYTGKYKFVRNARGMDV